jgi:hypothetical protein
VLLLIMGLLELPLGVLALANPGRDVLAFEFKRLPDEADKA